MYRYTKLGSIKKRRGIQLYEFLFNYGLLNGDETEVFIRKRPTQKKRDSDEGVKMIVTRYKIQKDKEKVNGKE